MTDYYFEETVVKRYCVTAENEEDARSVVNDTHMFEEVVKDFELIDVVEDY